MDYLLFLFIISQITFAVSSSLGRYGINSLKNRPFERYRRTHNKNDCMYNICEHISDYPEKKAEAIINQHKTLHSYFGGSVIEPSMELSIFRRNNEEPPVPFCKTNDISVMPKLMEDVDGIKRSIANAGNYTQILKFQTCSFENDEGCFPGNVLGFKTYCVQKFNDIKLVTINFEQEILEYMKFKIPSTCVCTYTKKDGDY